MKRAQTEAKKTTENTKTAENPKIRELTFLRHDIDLETLIGDRIKWAIGARHPVMKKRSSENVSFVKILPEFRCGSVSESIILDILPAENGIFYFILFYFFYTAKEGSGQIVGES